MRAVQTTMAGYRQLVQACLPGCELWLYSAGGALAWLTGDDANAPTSLDLSACVVQADGALWHIGDQVQTPVWAIVDGQEDPTHYLLLRTPPEHNADAYHATADPIMGSLVQRLGRELQLQGELDAMARELALRYEELNLVYHTDDEVRFLDEGRHALRALVDNCNEYLSVDMTLFSMPRQGVCIERRGSGASFDHDAAIAGLAPRMLDTLTGDCKTHVFNDPERLQGVLPGITAKALLSPVRDGQGQISGVLAIFRRNTRPDFVNGDRNLLVVMAGKASKIIQASYDSLTGLMKQDGFERSVRAAFAYARRVRQTHSLLHINVDRMHLVNDTMGYQVGDNMLRSIAAILREQLRDSDHIARLGGDEFGVLLHNCPLSQGELVAEKLRRAIASSAMTTGEKAAELSVCIGISALDEESDDVISAQAGAEIACAVAKERGRNRWYVYRRDDAALVERQQQMKWVNRIRDAVNTDNLTLYSQRILPLARDTRGYHFEILVRMLGDDGEILAPYLFLPVAERYQLMPSVDRWIVANACAALAPHAETMCRQEVVCTINLSGQSLVDEGVAAYIGRQLADNGIPGHRVCFEITETAAIANLEEAQQFIHEVKRLGCTFALDDFGAGLSSFAYLRSLPVDYLKLDGSFVKNIAEDDTAAAMLAAMNQIGKIVGLETVAEFVESEAIVERLRKMGVDYGQGYGLARPQPLADELTLLAAQLQPA